MIKFIITLVLTLISNMFFAQSALDKYSKQDGVGTIIVNKKMFQMMGSVKVDANDKQTQQYLSLMKKLDDLKVYTTTNAKIAAEMKLSAEQYKHTAGLAEFTGNNDKNVKMWVKNGVNNQVKELLMYSEDNLKGYEMVLLSLTGDFTLSEITVLIDKMKIANGEELKRAAKGM